MTEALRRRILAHLNDMTSQSLRCLGFASKALTDSLKDYSGNSHPAHKCVCSPRITNRLLTDVSQYERIESGLTFFGICGIKDPARPEVRESIEKCKEAGIRVFMITGDNQTTAEAIARDVGIFEADEDISKKSYLGGRARRA